MLGSTVLETAIGLVFVYLVFSLIASAIAEYISSVLDRPSDHLKHILFNLFDNDDPQGRTMLNLFIAAPDYPGTQFDELEAPISKRRGTSQQKVEQFDLARNKWNAAATAVAAADQAREAATKATDAAAAATTAWPTSRPEGSPDDGHPASPDLLKAVNAAAVAARAADARPPSPEAAAKATAATELLARVKKWQETPAGSAVQPPARRPPTPTPSAGQVTPPAAPPLPSASELAAHATQVVDEATRTAQAATAAAAQATARPRLSMAPSAGLDSALTELGGSPQVVFQAAHFLICSFLSSPGEQPDPPLVGGLAFQEMHQPRCRRAERHPSGIVSASALAILQGVATRLSAGDAKDKVEKHHPIGRDISLAQIKSGEVEALGAVGLLEKGTNDLLAAVATVPDDSLRAALEREIQTSLRPLHTLGQNLLTLKHAGQTIAMMADSSIKTALSAFLTQAGEDLDAFRKNVGSWFNDVMDHASGWYKHNTQFILIFIAFFLCVINNVDTVSLVGHLSSSSEMRNAALEEDPRHARCIRRHPGFLGNGR